MSVRLLLTAGALSLGLASGALAQGMQAQPGMDPSMQQGQMGDDTGQQARPTKGNSGRKMTKPMKGSKKTMRARGSRAGQGGPDAGGPGMGGADDGM